MSLTTTQRRVAAGMAGGLATTLLVFSLSASLHPVDAKAVGLNARLAVVAAAILAPALSLVISIARLAKHRFFNAKDIDGSALTQGTDQARLLQALLQNTLEQTAIAIPVYLCWGVVASHAMLAMVAAAGILFLAGRLLFFIGYSGGAASRAFGFALTFYPTLVLLIGCAWFLLRRAFG
jgi:uncharacterized membrane protein YecN with MAPEG domain